MDSERLTRPQQREVLQRALSSVAVGDVNPSWDAVEYLACHGYAIVRVPGAEHKDCPDNDNYPEV